MNIDYSLLDQLKQYFQGKLDPETTQSIAKKLEEDPVYQAHAYIYKVSEKGIGAHQRHQNFDDMNDFSSAIDVEGIWRQDRLLTQKKRWIMGLLGMLLAVVASILILNNLPEKTVQQVPIAEQDTEAEVLFGSEGQERIISIIPFKWDSTNQLIPLKGEQEVIILHPSPPASMSYTIEEDTLHLYTPRVDYGTIQWIATREENSNLLLRLGNQLFDIDMQQQEGSLKVSQFSLEDIPK